MSRSVSAAMSAIDEAGGVECVVSEDAGRPGTLEREQGLKDQRIAVAGAGGGGMLDHRVLAAHLVDEGGHPERVLHTGDDVKVRQAGLHHHEIGALGEIELDLPKGLL